MSVKVLAADKTLEVTGTMSVAAAAAQRDFVEFSLSELMREVRVEVLSPRASSGLARVENARTEGGFFTTDGTPNRDAVYRVHPSKPFPAREPIELRFRYSGGGTARFIFHVGPEVTFASAYGTTWYPQLNEASQGIGSMEISVPAGEQAIASGDRTSTLSEEERGIFRFQIRHPTFLSFAAGKFTVVRRDGPVRVSVYLLRARPGMTEYLAGVQRILKTLAEEFGPYRFKEFALVEIPRELAKKSGFNAATPQGFAYINSNAFNVSAARFNVLLEWYGHEYSHEWWPHVVSLKRPGGRFIEEMLAEYGGLRAVETIAGPAAAERFRRIGYEHDPIYSALEYFKLVGKGIDAPIGDLPADEKFRNIAYNKGFLVWDMLSREIGRRKFQSVLGGITRRYAFRRLTLKEFWREIEAGAGRDLGWFYDQWFERTGAPEFQLNWTQAGSRVSGAITQAAPYYRTTLQIEIEGDNGRRLLRNVRVGGARTTFVVPVGFRARSVTLDPHYHVLRWTPEYRAAAGMR
ncbi:MAG TPA: M1 family aminopeptidase [Pyrinomonadaceae bacterium]|nr:M1 family aminopeptidase [Pyrinomonadaceae bacterium]